MVKPLRKTVVKIRGDIDQIGVLDQMVVSIHNGRKRNANTQKSIQRNLIIGKYKLHMICKIHVIGVCVLIRNLVFSVVNDIKIQIDQYDHIVFTGNINTYSVTGIRYKAYHVGFSSAGGLEFANRLNEAHFCQPVQVTGYGR